MANKRFEEWSDADAGKYVRPHTRKEPFRGSRVVIRAESKPLSEEELAANLEKYRQNQMRKTVFK